MDEATGKNRTIPFELMVQGDKVPVYEETLEDNGRFNEQPVRLTDFTGARSLAGCARTHARTHTSTQAARRRLRSRSFDNYIKVRPTKPV